MTKSSEPFRFDDRSSHYGAGQADLAPVSPVAAAPRLDPAAGSLDPMGASPHEPSDNQGARWERADGGAELGTRVETSATVQTSAVSAPYASDGPALVRTGEMAPVNPRPGAPDGQPAQTMTITISGQALADAETASAPDQPAAQNSGSPILLLTPALTGPAVDGPSDFAAIALQMDRAMAEMWGQVDALSPGSRADDEDDTPLMPEVEDFQDRFAALSEGLFGGDGEAEAFISQDPLLDAQARLDGLLGRNPTNDAESDSPAPSTARAGPLSQLFDGDAAPAFASLSADDRSERFDGPGAFLTDSPGLAFASIGWDDLPDFG